MSSFILILLSGFNLLLISPLWVLKRDVLKFEIVFHSILFIFGLSYLFLGYLNPYFVFILVFLFKFFLSYFFDFFKRHKFSLDVLVVAFLSSFYALGVALLNYLINKGILNFDFTKLILVGNPVYYDLSLINGFILVNLLVSLLLIFFLNRFFSAYFFNLYFFKFFYTLISLIVVFISVYVLGLIPTLALSSCSFFILRNISFGVFFKVNLFSFIFASCLAYYLFISTSTFLFGPSLIVFYVFTMLIGRLYVF